MHKATRLPGFIAVGSLILSLAIFAVPAMAQGGMADLAVQKDYSSHRVSSYDPSGGNADGRQDWPIKPGETRELASIDGAGAITHIWVTIASNDPHHLRNLVLRMYWDGEETPSVECPIGDFFGLGHAQYYQYTSAPIQIGTSNGLNCFWRMPFSSSARVTLTNDGPSDVRAFYYYIDYEQHDSMPDTMLRFHAQYRQAYPCTPGQNYVFLEAEGRGHYAGCNLSIHNRADGWWGEGDDMIYIDGSTTPQLHGTGSEDYFCGAWCYGPAFSNPYFGCPLRGEHATNQNWNVYRYHIESPIAFQESIRVTIEHGHANDRGDDFSSVAYWYQSEPHAAFPALPPASDRLPAPAEKFVEANAVEAEADIKGWTGDGNVSVQQLGDAQNRYSNGAQAFFQPEGPAAYTRKVDVPANAAGKYSIEMWYTTSWDYGNVQIAVNGQQAAAWNGYSENVQRHKTEFTADLKSGENTIEIRILDKAAQSKGHFAGIDAYRMKPAQTQAPEPAPAKAVADLAGTTWKLDVYTLAFKADHVVEVMVGNELAKGEWRLDGTNLEIKVANQFFRGAYDGETMTIGDETAVRTGQEVEEETPAPRAEEKDKLEGLAGTTWQIDAYKVTFKEGGETEAIVNGQTMKGTWKLDGSRLTISGGGETYIGTFDGERLYVEGMAGKLLEAPEPEPAAPAPAASLVGTTWRFDPYVATFKEDGVAELKDGSETMRGKWTLDGKNFNLILDGQFYTGTYDGERFMVAGIVGEKIEEAAPATAPEPEGLAGTTWQVDQYTVTFNADNTLVVGGGGQSAKGAWKLEGERLSTSVAGNSYSGTYKDGKLAISGAPATRKEPAPAATGPAEEAPAADAAIAGTSWEFPDVGVKATFEAAGKVLVEAEGQVAEGTWELKYGDQLTIEVGGSTYRGVFTGERLEIGGAHGKKVEQTTAKEEAPMPAEAAPAAPAGDALAGSTWQIDVYKVEFKPDGKLSVTANGETAEGTYKLTGSRLSASVGGSSYIGVFADGRLYVEGNPGKRLDQ